MVRLLIHLSAYVADVISLHLVAHYQRFTRQILVNSLGIIFQMAITVLIWFYLYKSLGIMMIKIHFEVYPLFVLDTRFCWKFSFSRKVTQHCASFDLAAATTSTKRCT